MIQITNVEPVMKGSLYATCDVTIKPWGEMELIGVKIFQKGNTRWLGMPSKEFTNEMGEKKYIELIRFPDKVKDKFRKQVMESVDKFLADNPELKSEPLIKESDELPF